MHYNQTKLQKTGEELFTTNAMHVYDKEVLDERVQRNKTRSGMTNGHPKKKEIKERVVILKLINRIIKLIGRPMNICHKINTQKSLKPNPDFFLFFFL